MKMFAGGLQREAAQPDVLLAAFGGLERDAGGVLQRVLQRVEVAVVEQLLGHDRDGLRHVAQRLVALGHAGGRGAHAVLALRLGLRAHVHGGQTGLGRRR
jgi:hypothetical protein